ncbi:MAG: tetratricopeptide repeat protein [Candidatus Schekmanbacteria bacterium]|nr:tetratricopeptide repeat protein [Candidatus Schekmanbacteria bacterium]
MDAEELYLRGAALARKNQHAEALALLEQAIVLDPRYLDAIEVKGLVHLNAGDFAAAEQAFRELLRIDPECVLAYANLSRLYQRQGMIQLAEEMQAKAKMLSWKAELAGSDDS